MLLIQNNLNRLEVCHHAKDLRFLVSDKDHAYSEKIGEVQITAGSLLSGDRIEGKDAKNKFNLCKGSFNIVYVRNHYFSFGPTPKPKPKLADPLYNVLLGIARNFLETRENVKISTHPFYHTNLD